jgi:hypothetical protein
MDDNQGSFMIELICCHATAKDEFGPFHHWNLDDFLAEIPLSAFRRQRRGILDSGPENNDNSTRYES